MTAENKAQKKDSVIDWIIRLLKGVLIGVGFITPGLSGGILAVVFGIYEPLLRFLGNIKEKFIRNILFFLPVGIGGVIGVVAFSAVVDFAFSNYAEQFTWLFIGFIAGTFPSLFRTSGKKGRKGGHWLVLVLTAAATVFLMRWTEDIHSVQLTPSFWNWLLSGGLIALGVVVPGMSPSNFLIYLGLYQPMAVGIKHLDLGVIVPLLLGGIVVVLLFARLVSWLFKKFYAFMYHFILGIVVGSTIVIIPSGVRGWTIAVCALLFIVGAFVSYFLAKLDEKYEREDLFVK
jgi:putative membrane protein